MKKILTLFKLPDEVGDKYNNEFVLESPSDSKDFTLEEITERLPDANAYLGRVLNREMIDKACKLEIASSFGAGYDGFDHKYAGEKGIWIMNSPHATTEPTAELAITLMLCLSRKILNYHNIMKLWGGVRVPSPFVNPFGDEPAPKPIHGKILGIVGFGKIGKAVARKANGLGMNVIYYDVYRSPKDIEENLKVKYVTFDELLKTADIVSLHCLYTPEHHHLMDAEQFRMMKPTAFFINATAFTSCSICI